MLDRDATNEATTMLADDGVNGQAEGAAPSLEQRVSQLEHAVTKLENTEQLEERIVSRVADRIIRNAPVAVAQPAEPPGFFSRFPRALLPMAVTTITPPGAAPARGMDTAATGLKRAWAFVDLLVELRAFWRMYVDPRYRLTWMGRVIPAVLLAAIFTSWFWLPGALLLDKASATVATLYVKVADLVLAYFLYKVLNREARRYRDCFPDAPTGTGDVA